MTGRSGPNFFREIDAAHHFHTELVSVSREWDDGGAHVKQQLLAAVGADDSKAPDDDVADVQEPEQKKPRTATAAKSKVARKSSGFVVAGASPCEDRPAEEVRESDVRGSGQGLQDSLWQGADNKLRSEG